MSQYVVSTHCFGESFSARISKDGGKRFRTLGSNFASKDLAQEGGKSEILKDVEPVFLNDLFFWAILCAGIFGTYIAETYHLSRWDFWLTAIPVAFTPTSILRAAFVQGKEQDRISSQIVMV